MGYYINGVGQVIRRVESGSYIEETHFCMEYEYRITDLADKVVYEWYKFDLGKVEYIVDTTNETPIIVDWIEYIPVNGTVEIAKSAIVEPETDKEIANLYEAVVVLDNRVTILEGGM